MDNVRENPQLGVTIEHEVCDDVNRSGDSEAAVPESDFGWKGKEVPAEYSSGE